MAVKASTLETPERGLELETREEPGPGGKSRAAAELKALRDRIEQLRANEPPEAPKVDVYSKDWWRRGYAEGWRAALEAIKEG